MGRRSRARERAASADSGTGQPRLSTAGAGARRAGLLGLLNPFKFRPPSRSRARLGALGFGLSAVLFAVLGWITGEGSWFSSAVLLAVLALAWGARAAFLRDDDRPG